MKLFADDPVIRDRTGQKNSNLVNQAIIGDALWFLSLGFDVIPPVDAKEMPTNPLQEVPPLPKD